jgi:EAL domain-containing protein (putative c-di-GMP-specific phosphodiesterase class I)/GGDEF domain-containing protein
MTDSEQPRHFFDAHAGIRRARLKFLQYAEFRYRQFMNNPAQTPYAAAAVYYNNWQSCRDRFGFTGLEEINRQIEARVVPELGPRDICARFVDEALVLVLSGSEGQRDLDAWAERLLHLLGERAFLVEQRSLAATFSIGMCWFDRRVRGAEEALLDALHTAEVLSERDENRYRIFQPRMVPQAKLEDEEELFARIQRALDTNRLRIVFQPLLAPEADDVRFAEVWARMVAEDGTLMPARHMLTAARRSGVLSRLDRWTLRRTMHFMTHREENDRLKLIVHVTVDSLDAHTLAWMQDKFDRHPRLRFCLIGDLNHNELSDNPQDARRLLDRLRDLDMAICVSGVTQRQFDDLLVRWPDIGYVKLSPTYVRELKQEDGDQEALNAFIALAHDNGVRVILPEVESEADVVNFWRQGVDLIQGDYVAGARELVESSTGD